MATLRLSANNHSEEYSHNAPFFASMVATQTDDMDRTAQLSPLCFVAPQPLPVTAQRLVTHVEPVSPEMSNQQIFTRFAANPLLRTLQLVKNGIPIGIVKRQQFITRFSQSHRLAEKICTDLLQHEPLLVEKNMPLEELGNFLAEVDSTLFTDGFIITERGRYIGIASAQDVLRELSKMHIDATRHANPLTSLPGNVPTTQHIERLMKSGTPFVACHANLSRLKCFNQAHGHKKGDEMIQLAGRILDWACDPKQDFIGHIGGDDFVLLMQSRDWKSRCANALDSFAQASMLLTKEHQLGEKNYLNDAPDTTAPDQATCLSMGTVKVTPGNFSSHHEVRDAMSAALDSAKRMGGNNLFASRHKLDNKTQR
ncbi:MAG: diguanylate cyclase [Gallionella sp.]